MPHVGAADKDSSAALRTRSASGGPGSPRKRAPRMSRMRRQESRAGVLFAMPWIIGMIVFTIGPIIVSIVISLTDWNLVNPPNFVGLANYKALGSDPGFLNSVKVTLLYVLIGVPVFQIAGLGLAMMLNLPLRGMRIFRTIMFLPAVLSGVAVAVLWLQLLNQNGPIDEILESLGMRNPPGWLSDPNWAVPAVVFIGVWGIGAGAIIYLSGLQNVPPQLYEQARIDGAGAIRCFFFITLPLLTPTLLFTLLTGIIGAFQVFDVAFIIGGPNGGSSGSLSFYLLYLWDVAFHQGRFGYASALAWVFVVVAALVIIVILRTSDRWVHDESETS
jgi:multiple sugar transport system permease protein